MQICCSLGFWFLLSLARHHFASRLMTKGVTSDMERKGELGAVPSDEPECDFNWPVCALRFASITLWRRT